MAKWRVGRGFDEDELARELHAASTRMRNFAPDERTMTPAHGWNRHSSKAVIARASDPAEARELFEHAWRLVESYAFSDPRIVKTHFDPRVPLLGRRMLLEVRVLGVHALGAVIVGVERNEPGTPRSLRGFRYDTLEGHFERGYEWFLVEHDERSHEITFHIEAAWQRGELPNAIVRAGFALFARRYQRAWHRLAHLRLRAMLGSRYLEPLPPPGRLVHEGPALPVGRVHALTGRRARPAIFSEHEAAGIPSSEVT